MSLATILVILLIFCLVAGVGGGFGQWYGPRVGYYPHGLGLGGALLILLIFLFVSRGGL